MSEIQTQLRAWIGQQIDADQQAWLDAACAGATSDVRAWNIAFATAVRRLPNQALQADANVAQHLCSGWQPQRWSLVDAVRVLLLLHIPTANLAARVADVFTTADLSESVACYRGLAVFSQPEQFRDRAAEGIRTNVQDIFCAVAHHNPYPAQQLADGAWNQMVLKALFVGVPLYPIHGLDTRCNQELSTMLADYARERRAASRPISAELWRCVGPCANDAAVDVMAAAYQDGSTIERDAVALALHSSDHPQAATILATDAQRHQAVTNGTLSWQSVIDQL